VLQVLSGVNVYRILMVAQLATYEKSNDVYVENGRCVRYDAGGTQTHSKLILLRGHVDQSQLGKDSNYILLVQAFSSCILRRHTIRKNRLRRCCIQRIQKGEKGHAPCIDISILHAHITVSIYQLANLTRD
jgi:hypothetical protein